MNKFFGIATVSVVLCIWIFWPEEKVTRNNQVHNVIDCTIIDMAGKIVWSFRGGGHCLFFEDGRFVVAQKNAIKMYDKNLLKLWKLPIPTHHGIHISRAKDEILVVSDTYHDFKNKKMRFDRLFVINLEGKILKDFDFFIHREDIDKITPQDKIGDFLKEEAWVLRNVEYPWEFSHVNSFYEIPENLLEKEFLPLKRGNYIVNVNQQNVVMILDKDLSKILWSLPHREIGAGDEVFHDVHIQKSGEMLIYFNRDGRKKFSTIDLYNPWKKRLTTLFKGAPPNQFYNEKCGGAQILKNGNLLFSDSTSGTWAFEVDKNRKKVWSYHYKMIPPNIPQIYQQIKRYDLSGFLKNNSGI